MLDWVQNVTLQVNTTGFLKFRRKYLPDSKKRWKHFNQLSAFEVQINLSYKLKPIIETAFKSISVLKNICHENILKIVIKASTMDFIFSKIPYFQHILLNTFRRMSLKYKNYCLRRILFQKSCRLSFGISSQIFGPRNRILSVPLKTVLTERI